jgi:hypothetical protein
MDRMKRIKVIIIQISLFLSCLILIGIYYHFNCQFWKHRNITSLDFLVEYKTDNIYGFRGQQILINRSVIKHMGKLEAFAIEHLVELVVIHSYR